MAGVTLQLARETVLDPIAALVGVVALVLLLRFNINSAWLVIAGGVVGLAVQVLSSS
jgi:chromate transporter